MSFMKRGQAKVTATILVVLVIIVGAVIVSQTIRSSYKDKSALEGELYQQKATPEDPEDPPPAGFASIDPPIGNLYPIQININGEVVRTQGKKSYVFETWIAPGRKARIVKFPDGCLPNLDEKLVCLMADLPVGVDADTLPLDTSSFNCTYRSNYEILVEDIYTNVTI